VPNSDSCLGIETLRAAVTILKLRYRVPARFTNLALPFMSDFGKAVLRWTLLPHLNGPLFLILKFSLVCAYGILTFPC
jgi:hypothetical protein